MSAIIVETGRGIFGANAYADLYLADAYLVPRGLWLQTPVVMKEATEFEPASFGPDEEIIAKKEAAIIRAADALEVLNWRGDARFSSGMAWPRINVELNSGEVPLDEIPKAVIRANIELAGLIFNGTADPLAPVERGGKIISKSESTKEGDLDVIGGDSKSYSITYAEAAPVETYLPSVYGLLRPYLIDVPGEEKSGMQFGKSIRA